jgi:hypothetical protein
MIDSFLATATRNCKIISLKDKGSKSNLIFDCNNEAFLELHVDSEGFTACYQCYSGKKCDYAIASEKHDAGCSIILYVELKGGDIKTAYEQIFQINRLFSSVRNKTYGVIVGTGNPKASTIKQQQGLRAKKEGFSFIFTSGQKKLALRYDNQNNTIVK